MTTTWPPATVTFASGSGRVAGPFCTLPSSIENLLPWHWQLIVPPSIAGDRAALVGADLAERLELPGLGWVIT